MAKHKGKSIVLAMNLMFKGTINKLKSMEQFLKTIQLFQQYNTNSLLLGT